MHSKYISMCNLVFFLILVFVSILCIDGCTNIIITSGVSQDSSNMIAYNADSSTLYGSLYHYPATNNSDGIREIFNWDTGQYNSILIIFSPLPTDFSCFIIRCLFGRNKRT